MQLCVTALRQSGQRSVALNYYVVAQRASTKHPTQLQRRNFGKIPAIYTLVELIIGFTHDNFCWTVQYLPSNLGHDGTFRSHQATCLMTMWKSEVSISISINRFNSCNTLLQVLNRYLALLFTGTLALYLPVWHSHCTKASFTVVVWCSDELAVHACPFLRQQTHVAKLASTLFFFS